MATTLTLKTPMVILISTDPANPSRVVEVADTYQRAVSKASALNQQTRNEHTVYIGVEIDVVTDGTFEVPVDGAI